MSSITINFRKDTDVEDIREEIRELIEDTFGIEIISID